ncbi:hypothetical protein ACFX1Z_019186 [Malus domestica]
MRSGPRSVPEIGSRIRCGSELDRQVAEGWRRFGRAWCGQPVSLATGVRGRKVLESIKVASLGGTEMAVEFLA